MIGQTVSHYRVEEKVGEGGMGVVYRAEDLRLKRSVALKFLPPHLVADVRSKERFLHEARAASALDHPNVCAIHEIEELEDGELFIAMAYYGGETLGEKIAKGPLPIADAIGITQQVAQGLSKAHERGIVHRDIKPANLKVTEDGIWKILDFGIAKLTGATRQTRSGGAAGTMAYMSPEQAGTDEAWAQSDIWSLGVVLYQMLAGRLPFRGSTPVATLYQILKEEPDPIRAVRPDVPHELAQIVDRALAKELDARYATMAEVLSDLAKVDGIARGVEVRGDSVIEGEPGAEAIVVTPPTFLTPRIESSDGSSLAPFVGRDAEIEVLDGWLQEALAGRGRVGFITGDAGSGKTALAREFCRRAAGADSALIVATGVCNAHTGIGDSHRPFREILSELTGDVEAKWSAGSITAEHATRLWSLLPSASKTLLESGADLVGTFIPEGALLGRAESHPLVSVGQLEDLRTIRQRQAKEGTIQQADLFGQYVRVLRTLSADQPLLLVVDDLQWADAGSIGLLFELGHHLAGSRILILGLYRTTEVALGRDGERHPLASVVHELAGVFGNVVVEFKATADRDFVDALIDAEPNRLDAAFREALFQQTKGHALFTVELLDGLKQQGLVIRSESEEWVEGGASIDWDVLPARVDAVVAERLDRLDPSLRRLLTIASVEGERFTLEALAEVHGVEPRELIAPLSLDLEKRHKLVVAEGLERVNGGRLSVYRFRHILFQRHLYQRLDDVERPLLHELVGEALEVLNGEHAEECALSLAYHFSEAGLHDRASDYLMVAGGQSERSLVPAEALVHYEAALAAMLELPRSDERDRRELRIQLATGTARLMFLVPGFDEAYMRALELAERLGTPLQLFWANSGVFWVAHYAGDWGETEAAAMRCLRLAREIGDTSLLVHALEYAGRHAWMSGERHAAVEYYVELIGLYDRDEHWTHLFFGLDVGDLARSTLALAQWDLGYPEKAAALFEESTRLTKQVEDFHTLHLVLYRDVVMRMMSGEIALARDKCDESFAAMARGGRPGVAGPAQLACQGWCDVCMGRTDGGLESIRLGIEGWQAMGNNAWVAYMSALLARGLAKVGRAQEGLKILEQAIADPLKNEPSYQSAVQQHLGDLYLELPQPDEAAAEAAFRRAIDIAQEQEARSHELLATTPLARLLRGQGRTDEARDMLGEIYGWFTEGHDWQYLIDARELLEELGGSE